MTPLRHPDFRLLFGAWALSSVGDLLAVVALTIRVHDLTHSGFAVTALLLTELVGHLALAPVAGYLVDRFETSRVLAGAVLFEAGAAVGLAFVDSLGPILILALLLGFGHAVEGPSIYALVPRMLGEEQTTSANAYLELARYGGASLGPVAGGVITAALGVSAALLANAGTFLVVVAAALLIRTRRPTGMPQARRRRGELRKGFTHLVQDPLLRLTVIVLAGTVLLAAIDNVAWVFFAKDVLQVGDAGYGAFATVWTLGMVTGALVIARKLPPVRLTPAVMTSSIVLGAAVAVAAAGTLFPLVLAMFFVGGAANGVENVAMRSLIHKRAPDEVRGRVFAAYSGLLSAAHVTATVLGGVLVTLIGSRFALLTAGLGGVAVGLAGLVVYLRSPRRDDPVSGLQEAPLLPLS